ncbi:YbhN family protein [Funiculus sociatus GB2-A5]|uniref:YbhN family protein n=1 Tax=Funiculus sociatus GB2-A5 TaxID=2933946 RepID=A0ABV0JRP8_9CYAN|nr:MULTISPECIES: YbhN family protein [unclassified Trichocoleus]MBD1905023.1 flippase-like domain-containing protein [Trichocoleus sp. FACHB-832]MBD2064093.1 flippase-like domain-containing protein [Trichocoleus sp. FACHB-6]
MKKIWSTLKPYLRWVILGATLFFLAKALKDNWREVAAIQITGNGWTCLAIAFLITLLAHTWSGWVWSWILQSFRQPVQPRWVIQVYLKTNLAKYLPGNVWHYYGRIVAVTSHGGSLGAATLSVVLEPLLMVAAALLIALIGSQAPILGLQILSLAVILLGVHPRILNPLMQLASKLKGKRKIEPPTTPQAEAIGFPAPNQESPIQQKETSFRIERYPLLPLLGEIGFLLLRGTGFLFAMQALVAINSSQIPMLLSAFSLAWLLGLVVPGAPGGIGVFEATALALLRQQFSPAILISVVALFRMVSVLAEVAAAGLASLVKN